MNLKNLRNKINGIDERIVSLLHARAKISRDIGEVKVKSKKGIYSPAREKEVLKRIEQLNKEFSSQLLISEKVLQKINPDTIEHESMGVVQLKGREKPIHVYKIL